MSGVRMFELPVLLPSSCKSEAEHNDCRIGSHHFRIGNIGAADESEVLRLFAEVFGHIPDDRWYHWKYGCGQGKSVGLWDESGHLVAHYAGVPRTLLWYGKLMEAVQIGDVMVAPRVRGLLTRKGPFFRVCTRFFDSLVGAGKSYRLAFGFPNERAMTLGRALDIYHDAGKIYSLRWAAKPNRLPPWWRWSHLQESDATLDRQMAEAWALMANDMGDFVLGVRGADYLRWRFLERPDRQYRLFVLRRWPMGTTAAIVVLRFSDGGVELLDVVGARKTFKMAIRAAISEAARAGAAELAAWASPAAAAALGKEAVAVESGASLAVAKASVLTDDEVATVQWWWLGGDTDFL